MPHWDVEVANVFYIRLEAETEAEARRLAQHRITGQGGHEQRVLTVVPLKEKD